MFFSFKLPVFEILSYLYYNNFVVFKFKEKLYGEVV